MNTKKNKSAKLIALLLVLMLIIGGAVGGTLAWLIAETNPVTNTFTVGNIKIDLTETVDGVKTSAAKAAVTNDRFKMVPGSELAKDPAVTVEKGSEACWLFVEVIAENGVALTANKVDDTYVTYDIADGWEKVAGTNVYARKVAAKETEDQTFNVLAGDLEHPDGCVKIPSTVTKAMMDALASAAAPKLTFKAYAIQSENLNAANAAAAWAQIKSDLSLS